MRGCSTRTDIRLVVASTIPNIRLYDPAFAYETATIVRDGIERMYGADPQDVFYYLTLYNENYSMPERPEGLTDEHIVGGLYRFKAAPEIASDGRAPLRATLLAGGSIMQQALRAQTAARRARRGGRCVERAVLPAAAQRGARLGSLEQASPDGDSRASRASQSCSVSRQSRVRSWPSATSSRAWPDLVARWVPGGWYRTLGTDGFGRSDTREALRRFFEIDAESIAATTLAELARCGRIDPNDAKRQIEELGLDPEAPFSLHS